ncbi:MAG: hypothetical protein PHT07_15015 [Paludibacter sp.]|nr:hypothetical protein [Paludibacter sp.]
MIYDKFSAILDYFANDGKNKTINDLLIRWGWSSKSRVFNFVDGLKDGTEPYIEAAHNLVMAYLKATGEKLPAVPQESLVTKPETVPETAPGIIHRTMPETAPEIIHGTMPEDKPKKIKHNHKVDQIVKEPLFPDEPSDTGLQYPINTEKFKNIWATWIEYKRVEKRQGYKSIKSEQIAIDMLAKDANYDENEALELIRKAISSTWMGWHKNRRFRKKSEKIIIIDTPTPEDTEWTKPENPKE